MTTSLRYWSLIHFLILVIHASINQHLTFAQDQNQFIYNGFANTNLNLGGLAKIQLSNGLLQLTDTSKLKTASAFNQFPLKFNTSSSSGPYSFSTTFIFAMVPESSNSAGGHGIVFVISPSMDFSNAFPSQYIGLFNNLTDGLSSNHIFGIEFDTVQSVDFNDINDNHVGVDLNSLKSNYSTPAAYFSDVEGINKNLFLDSGNPIQAWIDYDGFTNLLSVTIAPSSLTSKPKKPLFSRNIDLSLVLLDSMYVGFTSATGTVASSHYLLGWSFSRSGDAQQLDFSKLPSLPSVPSAPPSVPSSPSVPYAVSHGKSGKEPYFAITISVLAVLVVIYM